MQPGMRRYVLPSRESRIVLHLYHGVRKEMVAPLPIFRIHSFWLESFSVGGVAIESDLVWRFDGVYR